MSGPSTTPITTFWRLAGMTYLQYVNRAASAVRTAVKTPELQTKLSTQEIFSYKATAWDNGTATNKQEITTLQGAGKV